MNSSFNQVGSAGSQRVPATRRRIPRYLTAILTLLAFSGAMAITMAPDALVMQTAREVQEIIRQDPDLQAGNRQKTLDLVEKKILPHFDFERMTMLAVGRDWSRASPEQRQALIAAFRSLLIRTYSSALARYRDHKIDVKPVKADAADNVAVRSQVSAPGAPPVVMDYRMHRSADGWKVHDVAVEGVSLVTTYRSSFKAEIDRAGFDGLVKLIANKGATSAADNGQEKAR
jgi:phospholipid transport system substrate-binding protein